MFQTFPDEPLERPLCLLDRDETFAEIESAIRGCEDRSLAVVVSGRRDDLPQHFAARIALEEGGLLRAALDLGGCRWTHDCLPKVQSALHARLQLPRDAGGTEGSQDPTAALSSILEKTSGHFVFHQWFSAANWERDKDRLLAGLDRWLGYFGGGCSGPRSGRLIAVLCVEYSGSAKSKPGDEKVRERIARAQKALGRRLIVPRQDLQTVGRDDVRDWWDRVSRKPPLSQLRRPMDDLLSDIFEADETDWVPVAAVRRKLAERARVLGQGEWISHGRG